MTLKEFRERTKDLREDYRIEFSTNGVDGIAGVGHTILRINIGNDIFGRIDFRINFGFGIVDLGDFRNLSGCFGSIIFDQSQLLQKTHFNTSESSLMIWSHIFSASAIL